MLPSDRQGLPFKANVDDVVKFYQGFTLGAGAVYLKRHPDGRLNGEVRCRSGRQHDLLIGRSWG